MFTGRDSEVEVDVNRRIANAHLRLALRCPLEDVAFHVAEARRLDAIADAYAARAMAERAIQTLSKQGLAA